MNRKPARTETIRIWHVDDSQDVREALTQLLNTQPGLVCERQFATAAAAISALKTGPAPDVLLLDLNLGDECGLDALKPMLAVCPGLRILMFTTFSDLMSEVHALENGAAGFLLKSYRAEQIFHLIRAAVNHPDDPQLFPFARVSLARRIASAPTRKPAAPGARPDRSMMRLLGKFCGWRHRTIWE